MSAFNRWWSRQHFDLANSKVVKEIARKAWLDAVLAEREAIISLAEKQGWAMKNEYPFEDAVRDICIMRARNHES